MTISLWSFGQLSHMLSNVLDGTERGSQDAGGLCADRCKTA